MAARQRDWECRPAPQALARRRDRPAIQFDQILNERQPQSQSAVTPRSRCVRLQESVENEWQEFRIDALARIADRDADVIGGALHPQLNAPAFGRELDGV